MPRVAITSFYPKVEFLDGQYLGDGPYNTCYQECDYCRDYKKIHVLNKPVYYDKGANRKLVSYCRDCYNAVSKGGHLIVVDEKYGGYYEILDAIKDSNTAIISFEEAVMKAFNRTENIIIMVVGQNQEYQCSSVILAVVIVELQIILFLLTTKDSGNFAINCSMKNQESSL